MTDAEIEAEREFVAEAAETSFLASLASSPGASPARAQGSYQGRALQSSFAGQSDPGFAGFAGFAESAGAERPGAGFRRAGRAGPVGGGPAGREAARPGAGRAALLLCAVRR